MRYYNGFQTLYIDRDFVVEMELYDKDLVLWQNIFDEYYYISYNPYRSGQSLFKQQEHVTNNIAMKIQDEHGQRRMPRISDIRSLVQRDAKFTTEQEILSSVKDPILERKREARRSVEERIRESAHGLALHMKRRPSLYE